MTRPRRDAMSDEVGVSASARSVGDTPRVSKRKSRGTSLSVPASPKNGGGDEAEAPAGSAKKGPNALPLFDATDGAVGLSFGAAARSITQPPPAKRQKQQSAPASSVDDEAFARALQEEENARYELERTESRRRGEEWRRQHEEMMFAADDLDELLDEDDEEDLESQDMATAEEDGETEVVADGQLSADSAAAAHRAARREAAQRARARVGQMHRFFGQMHAHIHAAGATPGERGDLAALCFSDRDFTDADYERLLTLDNTSVRRGLSETEMRGIPTKTWVGTGKRKTKKNQAKDTQDGEDRDRDAGEFRCAVCLDSFVAGDAVSTLRCTHQYHETCIAKWLGCHVECPVCRVDLTSGDAANTKNGAKERDGLFRPPKA